MFESDLIIDLSREGDKGNLPIVKNRQEIPVNLHLLPLKNLVLFPGMMVPLVVPKESSSSRMLEHLFENNRKYIVGVTTKNPTIDDPSPSDLFNVGTVAKIVKNLRLPDGSLSILLQTIKRVEVERFLRTVPFIIVKIKIIEERCEDSSELEALFRIVQDQLKEVMNLNRQISEEIGMIMANLTTPGALADFIAAHFKLKLEDRQQLLELPDVRKRLERLSTLLTHEINIMHIGKKIQDEIHSKVAKNQKEFFLREELKAIRRELGEEKDERTQEFEKILKLIEEAKMPERVRERVKSELERIRTMNPESSEYHTVRTYLDWLIAIPWSKSSQDQLNLPKARKILDQDHYGLKDVKERIIEFLAVRKLNPEHGSTILCLVGPPGVGKTSVGKSVAQTMGRKFYRFSVGGMRDEAEIKGHRRTYVAAMPGKIVQGLKWVGTNNPVFMLDEIDKIGADFRGDPSSALLEALDPEQNKEFLDHYLDIPVDLSNVMFIATANITDTIPRALLDRMEIIKLPGYIEDEKVSIAEQYIIPKQLKKHGIKPEQLKFSQSSVKKIIRDYTNEAGLRNLERHIAKICRKVASKLATKSIPPVQIKSTKIKEYLGVEENYNELANRPTIPGVAVGLAWTQSGGEVLFIESSTMPGKQQLELTGQLGEVMNESARIALGYVRSHADTLKIPKEIRFDQKDIHIHFPSGAIPKDGPSAGVTIVTSLVSLLRNSPIKPRLAMTGEVTLTGKILPVGGIREKIIAAKRAGVKEVIVPKENFKNVHEIPGKTKHGLKFHYASNIDEVLKISLPA